MTTPRVINEISHDTRATLQHVFARGGYKEIVRDGVGVITSIIIWVDNTRTQKIRETLLTRVLGKLSNVTKKHYDKDGNLTEVFTQDLDRNAQGKLTDVRLAGTIYPTGIGGQPISGAGSIQILAGGVSLGQVTGINFQDAGVSVAAGVAAVSTGGGAVSTFTGLCLSTLAVGDLVYAAGASRTVALADPAVSGKTPVIGIVTAKPTPTTCTIQVAGVVAGFSGLTPGYQLFLGRDGRPTMSPPTPAVGETITYQSIGVAIDSASILFTPSLSVTKMRG